MRKRERERGGGSERTDSGGKLVLHLIPNDYLGDTFSRELFNMIFNESM